MFLWISHLLHAYELLSHSTLPSHLAVIFVVPFVIPNNLSSWKGVIKQVKNRLLIASDGAGPRHVSTPGRLAILCIFKLTFFKLFDLRIRLAKILEGVWPNLGFFGNIPSRVKTRLIAQYMRLFQRRLSVPYRFEPRAGACWPTH